MPAREAPESSSLGSVVIGTDFSEASDVALSWAMTVARAHGVPLQLVHAASRTLPLLSRHNTFSPLAEITAREAGLRLERLADSIRSPDQVVESHLLHDRPSVSVLRVADWVGAGLIVQGTRGLGGVEHLMLGSTAERVAEMSICPVLSVGPRSKVSSTLPRRILVATDFSIEADAAALASQEICRFGGRPLEMLMLSVLNTPAGLEKDTAIRELWWEYVGQCKSLLNERLGLISTTFGNDVGPALVLLREGLPAQEIVRVANQEEVDLIALGSRGSFAAGLSFLGSVAKRVIQTARCPVMTVPSLFSKRMRRPMRDL
jgi:nucleotide-binding universal stress UspA family protein